MLDIDPYEEPDQDSDFDYEESYSSKRKRRKPRGGGHHPVRSHPPATESPAGKRTKVKLSCYRTQLWVFQKVIDLLIFSINTGWRSRSKKNQL